MKQKNVFIIYALSFLHNAWFWLGIWVLYYLLYTDYAGIGAIETIMILTAILTEIPTGAVADLLGKKKTIFLAFFFITLGNILTAFAPNFSVIAISIFFVSVGATFYSGTVEALLYDTLLESKRQHYFDKAMSNMNSVALIAPAVCGIIGGILYTVQPNLPFFLTAVAAGTGMVLAFFLVEPKVDSEKFTLQNYIKQTKMGFKQLFQTHEVIYQVILLLLVGSVIVAVDQMVNGFLGVEFGFSAAQLGLLWAVIYLVSAGASQLTPRIRKNINDLTFIVLTGFTIAISLLLSPVLGLAAGGLMLMFRSSLQALYTNTSAVMINKITPSQYRATTISTFNMFKNIPYVVLAFLIGYASDALSAKVVAAGIGVILAVLLLLLLLAQTRRSHNYPSVAKTV